DHDVLVEDGIITAVAEAGRVEVPDDAVVIDATGKFLLPGLVDMHVHFIDRRELVMYVAHGVTTVRNMGDFPDQDMDPASWAAHTYYESTPDVRDKVGSGEWLGPDMYLAGHLLDGPEATLPGGSLPIASLEAVAAAVEAEHDRGYDYIKVYDNLPPEFFWRVLEVAESLDMAVVGHAPLALSLSDILGSGMASNEHLTMFRSDPEAIVAMLDEIGPLTADSEIWNCPTLIGLSHAVDPASDEFEAFFAEPEWAYLDPATKQFVRSYLETAYYGVFPGDYLEIFFVPILAALIEAEARVIVGTDAPVAALPGVGMHQELELLVAAGMTAHEALRAATGDAALALDRADTFGTVEVGKRADLVLLGADPIADITNTRTIEGVMLRGRWMPRAELDALLAEPEP
ncbi:MAG TPA: amidohydrolase family protein, partial [Enhygromyxa sp.]|nr:amidohydrolase family protein [Enhygromyxa sp.]